MVSIFSPLSLNSENNSSNKSKMRGKSVSGKVILVLSIASFLAGSLFTSYTKPRRYDYSAHHHVHHMDQKLDGPTGNECDHKRKLVELNHGGVMAEVIKTHEAVRSLDKSISTLEMELAVARTNNNMVAWREQERGLNYTVHNVFLVIGINTAFSSKRRRDSIRETWMPQGEQLKKLEKEKRVVMRFVIGHSATPGGVLDRAIDAEDAENQDFLRLNHVEGYHELSTKTRLFFSKAVAMWDAEFYVKVDDDVHVNLGMLMSMLAKHRSKSRVYIGCMKSGPVLFQKGVKYHEPEHWKFGEEGNKYFRHATGQIYAISRDLATYISINSDILHRYANEDVSLGSWLIGLEVIYVDDHSMCCGTPPDCEFKSQAGNLCVASFDWQCSGICNSVERMKHVHSSCGEGGGAIWSADI